MEGKLSISDVKHFKITGIGQIGWTCGIFKRRLKLFVEGNLGN
jgi:hypothetical protein